MFRHGEDGTNTNAGIDTRDRHDKESDPNDGILRRSTFGSNVVQPFQHEIVPASIVPLIGIVEIMASENVSRK